MNENVENLGRSLKRQALCFSSYKNLKLKVKPWWVEARERKKRAIFVPFILFKGIFLTFVFYLNVKCIEYTFIIYIHFLRAFQKLPKAFSVSLSKRKWLLTWCYNPHESLISSQFDDLTFQISIVNPIKTWYWETFMDDKFMIDFGDLKNISSIIDKSKCCKNLISLYALI